MKTVTLTVSAVGLEFGTWALANVNFCKGAKVADLVYVQSDCAAKVDAVYPKAMAKRILKGSKKYGARIVDNAGLGL